MSDRNDKVVDLRTLLEISRALMSEQDRDRLLERIMTHTTRLLDAGRSSLFLFDPERDELYSRIAQKSDMEEIRVAVGEGIVGTVAETREMINIRDAYEDERFHADVDRETGFRTGSILSAPMINPEDDLIGVIQVLNKKDGVFTSYDEELLGGLAAQAAVAIENARLFEHYREKQKIQQSLRIARRIQQDLLPDRAPAVNGYELVGHSNPADETGGDYYDFFETDDGRIGVMIFDVTGHGVGPALLMATVRSTLHAILQDTVRPAEVLTRANDLLFDDLGEDRFATGCMMLLDPGENTFSYASAGHDPPYYLMNAGADEPDALDSTGLPLGIMNGATYEQNGPLSIGNGGLVVLYTDGFTETMNKQEESFGAERFRGMIRRNRTRPASRLVDEVEERVVQFRGDRAQRDDLTMVVVRRPGA